MANFVALGCKGSGAVWHSGSLRLRPLIHDIAGVCGVYLHNASTACQNIAAKNVKHFLLIPAHDSF